MTEERASRRRPPRQKPLLAPVPRAFRVSLPRPPTATLSASAIAALVLAAGYAIVAIALVARRYDAFALTDPILPAYTQALWALLHGAGKPTLLGSAHLEGSLFARHLHVAILALIPPLAITSSPIILLAAQAVAIAAGALVLHAIGARRLGGVALPIAVVIAYFLHPAVGFASIERFRMSALAVPFLFGAHLALLRDRRLPLALCLAAVALVREDLAVFAAAYGALLLLRRRAVPLALSLAFGAYLYWAIAIRLTPANPLDTTIDWARDRWFLRPELAPPAMFALTEILVLARRFARRAAAQLAVRTVLLGGFVIASVLLSGPGARSGGAGIAPDAAPAAHLVRVRRSLLDRIPSDAAIVASPDILPHVALRSRVYAFDRPRAAARHAEGPQLFPDARYALIDWSASGLRSVGYGGMRFDNAITRAFADGSWQVLYAADNLVLLHRPSSSVLAGAGENRSRPFAGEPQLYETLSDTTEAFASPLLLIDGALELLDVRVVAPPTAERDRVRVAFVWRLRAPARHWFRTVLDVLDESGNLHASVIHPIAYGIDPPIEWPEGRIVREDVWLAPPMRFPAGSYRLALRMMTGDPRRLIAIEPLSDALPAPDDQGRRIVASWSLP